MASRIPQSFIDELLERLDVVDIIDRHVPLKKKGRNFMACCPFHDEKTPSFSVNQEKQFYHCFGCGASGNIIGFLMDYERLTFPQAVETLADLAGLEVPKKRTEQGSASQHTPGKNATIYALLEKITHFYRHQLKHHPQAYRAMRYLKKRGLNHDIIEYFDIGYAPPGWDNLLKQLGNSDANKQWLTDSGMLIQSETGNKQYDRFRDRIIFPIRDNRGRITAFGGRALNDDKPKYLNSPETAVFHKSKELYGLYQARKNHRHLQRLMIVEGYMDVIALTQHQIGWSVATLGTATNIEHLKSIFRHCSEVVFCFDGDEAGRKAANKALETILPLMEDGRQARFLFLPDGEDPDSLIRKVGASAFEKCVEQSVPLERYLFDSQAVELNSHSERARLSARVTPLINQLPGGVFKELMLDTLAQRTGLARHQLNNSLQRRHDSPAQTSNRTSVATNQHQRQSRQQISIASHPILYAIGLLLYQPRAALRFFENPIDINSCDDPNASLLVAMLTFLKKHPRATSATLIGHWTDELSNILQQLPPMDHFDHDDDIEQVFIDTLTHIKNKQQHGHLDKQIEKIGNKPFTEQSEEEKILLKQLLTNKHGIDLTSQ